MVDPVVTEEREGQVGGRRMEGCSETMPALAVGALGGGHVCGIVRRGRFWAQQFWPAAGLSQPGHSWL